LSSEARLKQLVDAYGHGRRQGGKWIEALPQRLELLPVLLSRKRLRLSSGRGDLGKRARAEIVIDSSAIPLDRVVVIPAAAAHLPAHAPFPACATAP
jgi:hypothetical protein